MVRSRLRRNPAAEDARWSAAGSSARIASNPEASLRNGRARMNESSPSKIDDRYHFVVSLTTTCCFVNDYISYKAAVWRVFVIQPSRAVVVFACVPIHASPASGSHLRKKPVYQLRPHSRGAYSRINEQACEVARWRHRQRVLLNHVVRDADNALVFALRHNRMNRCLRVHDTRPCVA